MLSKSGQFVGNRIKYCLLSHPEANTPWPWPLAIRSFRADTPDAGHRMEEPCDDHAHSSSGTEGTGISSRIRQQFVPHPETLLRPRAGPARVSQPAKLGERRKVLAPGDNNFLGNVATLLVRSPQYLLEKHAHSQPQRLPRSWREVLESERFRSLFPRRTSMSDQAMQGLQALVASAVRDSGWGVETDPAGTSGPDLATESAEARQAAFGELISRLEEMQQHLQNNAPDGAMVPTFIFASYEDDASSGAEKPSRSASGDDSEPDEADWEPRTKRHGHRYEASSQDVGSQPGREAGAQEAGGGYRRGRGRRRRHPGERRPGAQTPAPPWDDTQPFQTDAGTVFHFWKLCPYG